MDYLFITTTSNCRSLLLASRQLPSQQLSTSYAPRPEPRQKAAAWFQHQLSLGISHDFSLGTMRTFHGIATLINNLYLMYTVYIYIYMHIYWLCTIYVPGSKNGKCLATKGNGHPMVIPQEAKVWPQANPSGAINKSKCYTMKTCRGYQ